MSRDRGIAAQRWTARILTRWWPSAETNPNGRSGRDILGTPGVWWEIKTSLKGTSPGACVAQARNGARSEALRLLGSDKYSELPIVTYWPPGVGERSPMQAICMMAFSDMMHLLTAAGYAPEPKEED